MVRSTLPFGNPHGNARSNPCDGADREPPYYPALHEVKPTIRSDARPRSRRLILFSLDVSASSPFAFYFIQVLKVLLAVCPIALILYATFIGNRRSLQLTWLRIVTSVWLVLVLISRSALSSSVAHHFMSGTSSGGEAAARQARLYFSTASCLWTAEQVMLVIFSVALFFVLRGALRSNPP